MRERFGTASNFMSRTCKTIGVIALTICVLCPIVELFDCWDHTEQTGNDTEYTLVVVGLCVEVAYAVGRLLIRSQVFRPSFRHLGGPGGNVVPSGIIFFYLPEIAASPPALSLRI